MLSAKDAMTIKIGIVIVFKEKDKKKQPSKLANKKYYNWFKIIHLDISPGYELKF